MAKLQIAQKAVIADGDKILLVRKSADDPNNPGLWELPGGRMKESESIDASIVREVREETGLTVTPGELIEVWRWTMSWHGEEVSVVAMSRYCNLADPLVVALQLEPDDYLAEQRWFARADLSSLDIIPSQRPTILRILNEV